MSIQLGEGLNTIWVEQAGVILAITLNLVLGVLQRTEGLEESASVFKTLALLEDKEGPFVGLGNMHRKEGMIGCSI